MGKNFNKGGPASSAYAATRKQPAAARNAPAAGKVTRRNISKKESDKKYKQKEYGKQVERTARIEAKRNEWEMRKQAKRKIAEFKRPAGFDKHGKSMGAEDAEWEDVDEHEKDVFDKDGYFDVMETEAMISAGDQRILEQFKTESNKPQKVSEGRSLADLIM